MALTKVTSDGITDGTIINADVNASAAIAGTKISPDFGSQAISTTNDSITIGDSIIHSGDTNTKIRFPAADTFSVETAGSQRLSITSGGDINIHNTTAASTTDPITVDLGGQFTANASITQANLKLKLYHNGSNGDATGITASATGLSYVSSHTTDHIFYTVPSSINSLEEKVRITSAGNVGINDTSPTAELSVAATAPHIDIGAAGGTRMKIGYEGNNCFFGGTASTAMFIWKQNVDAEGHPQASGSEIMRLDSDGKLLIGMSNASTVTQGMMFDAGGESSIFRTSGINLLIGGGQSGQKLVEFRHDGSAIGNISKSGTTGIAYNTSSDYRLKENVVAISDGITRLKTLKPSRFNFKVDTGTTVDGFLAHEVTAVPEAITGTKDAVDSNNNPVYQAIDQSKLVPLLTAALQEAIAKIEVLETEVAALKAS